MGKQKRAQKPAVDEDADAGAMAGPSSSGLVNGTGGEKGAKRVKKGKHTLAQEPDEETLPVARYKEPKGTSVASAATASHAEENLDGADDDAALLDPEEAGPTLAERIRLLSVQRGEPLTEEQMEAAGIEAPTDGAGAAEADASKGLRIPAGSLAQTLVQALHSGDSRLLEACFQYGDKKAVRNTVRRLPSQLVLKLVDELVVRLSRGKRGMGEGMSAANARRARSLIEWVRQVLTIHMSYLVTIPTLVDRLASLHATLQTRIDLHQKLLALNGRLDIVLAQLDLRKEAMVAVQRIPVKRAGTRRYVEGESSSSSEEDEEESEDEGSVEDVVLGSGSGSEDEDGSEAGALGSEASEEGDEEDEDEEMADAEAPHVNGLLDLEAEESGSGEDDDDDEEESLEEGEDEESDEVDGDEDEDED